MVQTCGNLRCAGSRQTILYICLQIIICVCVCVNCVRLRFIYKLHSAAAGRPVNYLTNYCFTYLSCISHIPTGNIQIYDADRRWSLFFILHLFPHHIRMHNCAHFVGTPPPPPPSSHTYILSPRSERFALIVQNEKKMKKKRSPHLLFCACRSL